MALYPHRHMSEKIGLLKRGRQVEYQQLQGIRAQDGNPPKVVLHER